MSGNFIHPTILNESCDIPVENTASFLEKRQFNKPNDFDERLSFESDTDFQSFLLPLEQDFTKSSKGYASLLASISKKVTNDAHYKNNNESQINMLLSENFANSDYLKKTNDTFLYNNSLCSTDFTVDTDNLYHERQTQLVHTSLEIIENHQNSETVFSESLLEITINALKNSHQKKDVSTNNENIEFLEKNSKTSCDYTVTNSGLSKLNDKSGDDNTELLKTNSLNNKSELSNTDSLNDKCNIDNSELSKIDSSDACNDLLNFGKDHSSGKQLISSEKTSQKENDSYDDDDDGGHIEESKENVFSFSEDSAVNFDSVNSMACQKNLHDSIVEVSFEGYVNACFEDYDFQFEESGIIKSINESWNDSMKNISEEPHESKRVSFVPLPDLVSIHSYEPEDDDYRYSLYVLDQLRFQERVNDFEHIIAPYLTLEHRANVYRRNCLYNEDFNYLL